MLTVHSRTGTWWSVFWNVGLEIYLLVLDHILRCRPSTGRVVSAVVKLLGRRKMLNRSLLPETLRSLVGDGSIPPPMINCTPVMYRRRRQEKRKAQGEGTECRVTDWPPRTPVSSMNQSSSGCRAD